MLVAVSRKPLSPLVAMSFPPWQVAGGGETEVVVHEGETLDRSQQSQPLGSSWAETTEGKPLSLLPLAWSRVLPWPPTTPAEPLSK